MKNPLEFSAFIDQKIRLDAYLCEILKTSRRNARNYCENSLVKVNKKSARSGILLKCGDEIRIDSKPVVIIPGNTNSKLKIEIIFENEDFLILNKTVGVHCVRLKDSEEETLADWLAVNFPETLNASEDIRESGLVNRLDYYTSGVLLAARSKAAWEILRSNKEMLKTYYALVEGRPEPQKIKLALENKNNSKVRISEQGQIRTTELISSEKIDPDSSIVKLQGNNFSRHQLRAHLSYIGSPLIGDFQYGGKNSSILQRAGFFLHSENIKFEYKNRVYNFSADSKELESLKKRAEQASPL